MRRTALGILSLAAAATLWAAPPGSQDTAPPSAPVPVAAPAAPLIAVEKDVIDLGEVARGTKAEGSFVLRNGGATPVKILSAKPG